MGEEKAAGEVAKAEVCALVYHSNSYILVVALSWSNSSHRPRRLTSQARQLKDRPTSHLTTQHTPQHNTQHTTAQRTTHPTAKYTSHLTSHTSQAVSAALASAAEASAAERLVAISLSLAVAREGWRNQAEEDKVIYEKYVIYAAKVRGEAGGPLPPSSERNPRMSAVLSPPSTLCLP